MYKRHAYPSQRRPAATDAWKDFTWSRSFEKVMLLSFCDSALHSCIKDTCPNTTRWSIQNLDGPLLSRPGTQIDSHWCFAKGSASESRESVSVTQPVFDVPLCSCRLLYFFCFCFDFQRYLLMFRYGTYVLAWVPYPKHIGLYIGTLFHRFPQSLESIQAPCPSTI